MTLSDGRVVLIGGGTRFDLETLTVVDPITAVDLFDPTSGRIVDAGRCETGIPGQDPLCLSFARTNAAAGRTGDGQVLLAGGETDRGPAVQVERLDPNTLTFDVVGDPLSERLSPAFATTPAGAVLMGGRQGDESFSSSAVVFANGGVAARVVAGLLGCPRAAATVATVGQWALLVGGYGEGGLLSDYYELVPIDPEVRQGACQRAPAEVMPRIGSVATVIDDRFVLITGGLSADDGTGRRPTSAEVDLFDTETNNFCRIGEMTTPRVFHAAAALPNDRILIVGGIASAAVPTALQSFEVLHIRAIREEIDIKGIAVSCADLGGLLITEQQPYLTGRIAPTATALGNDTVLVAGGFDSDGAALDSVEIFVPTR